MSLFFLNKCYLVLNQAEKSTETNSINSLLGAD